MMVNLAAQAILVGSDVNNALGNKTQLSKQSTIDKCDFNEE